MSLDEKIKSSSRPEGFGLLRSATVEQAVAVNCVISIKAVPRKGRVLKDYSLTQELKNLGTKGQNLTQKIKAMPKSTRTVQSEDYILGSLKIFGGAVICIATDNPIDILATGECYAVGYKRTLPDKREVPAFVIGSIDSKDAVIALAQSLGANITTTS